MVAEPYGHLRDVDECLAEFVRIVNQALSEWGAPSYQLWQYLRPRRLSYLVTESLPCGALSYRPANLLTESRRAFSPART